MKHVQLHGWSGNSHSKLLAYLIRGGIGVIRHYKDPNELQDHDHVVSFLV